MEEKLSELKSKLDEMPSAWNGRVKDYARQEKRRSQETLISNQRNYIQNKEIEIKHTKQAPPPIFNRLPSDRTLAMPIIFFMKPPKLIRKYADQCFIAQRCLSSSESWNIGNHEWDVDAMAWDLKLFASIKYSKPARFGHDDVDYISEV